MEFFEITLTADQIQSKDWIFLANVWIAVSK
jgi:hypothetical protein